jgi:hypothetical protein
LVVNEEELGVELYEFLVFVPAGHLVLSLAIASAA